MPKAGSWPPYGSNFSSGTTDAIGVLVESFNDCECALRFILLVFMRGNILRNLVVVEQMSSTAVVEGIQAYLAESHHRKKIEDAVKFALKSFETCRANRNSIVHFGMAWRDAGARKTRLLRVKLRSGRQRFTRDLKVGDVRGVADACHDLMVYLDDLSVALGDHLRGKRFIDAQRPHAATLLPWTKKPY
ncbi:hypothetical protein [Bradyrhizobium sp. MOS002]|uniref:hypothetical protein n=1 Tax=Bradyrhizobium sp. MOS002 TaxID=2133947 RepID=UPI000D12A51B|nr:hypothetical protein [Bradyrhizobium sp. MOS002]PSO33419.1 hypothetical protein C7G41_00060 [Bradyrhizobium sp. MOS002]